MTGLLAHIVTFSAGVVLLIVGGDLLVRGATRLSVRFGVSAMLIGLTVVAFGTSAPELALNIVAASRGNTGLSFGNVVGSNIANIGLILGLSALVMPLAVHTRIVRRELPVMLVISFATAGLAYAALPIPGEGLAWVGDAGRAIGRGDGLILLLAFVGFVWLMYRIAKTDRAAAAALAAEAELDEADAKGGLGMTLLLFVGGLAMLLGGGWLAERGSVLIAEDIGLSQEVIGLTIVAIATSLPELATSMMAVRRGQVDIAVGNVVGSNIFNLLLVMGATAGIHAVAVPAGGLVDLGVMLVLSVLLLPIAMTGGQRVGRAEGLLLVCCYVGYLGWRVWSALGNGSAEPTTG